MKKDQTGKIKLEFLFYIFIISILALAICALVIPDVRHWWYDFVNKLISRFFSS